VGSSAFHEGRGAGKKATPGGHRLVSGKELFEKKKGYVKKGRAYDLRLFFGAAQFITCPSSRNCGAARSSVTRGTCGPGLWRI
jgi:hypothetical protein